MMIAVGFPEVMASFGGAVMVAFAAIAIGWLCYCVYSVARAADALERIADALEKDDEEEGEVSK